MLLTTYEGGAAELGISPRKLRNLVRERGLEPQLVRFGRAVRLPRELIEQLARGDAEYARPERGSDAAERAS